YGPDGSGGWFDRWSWWNETYFAMQPGSCPPPEVPPIGIGLLYSTVQPLSQYVIDAYTNIWDFSNCSNSFSLFQFPKNIPVDKGESPQARYLFNAYHADFRQWNVPKLILFADPGVIHRHPRSPETAREKYPNTITKCTSGTGHFPAEETPHTTARHIL